MPSERVPVYINGTIVGSAFIHEDGTMHIRLEPDAQCRAILLGMNTGLYTGLVVSPVHVKPVIPNYKDTLEGAGSRAVPPRQKSDGNSSFDIH